MLQFREDCADAAGFRCDRTVRFYDSEMDFLKRIVKGWWQTTDSAAALNDETVPAFRPLQLPATDPVAIKLRELEARIKADFPHVALPDIHVVTDRKRFFGDMPFHPPAFYIPAVNVAGKRVEAGVYVTRELVETLTPDELVATIAHEFGHHVGLFHMGDKRAMLDEAQRRAGVTNGLAKRRASECEADHFAAHYVPGGREAFLQAMFKVGGGSKEAWRETDQQQHPSLGRRLNGHGILEAISMKPGSVTFDGKCEVITPNTPIKYSSHSARAIDG